uniref:Conotoxin tx5g n=1 Tax=Conus textile TaxID=6494 RepID=CT5G_CONTE|nr:RecName: Full=Conotoxin tx5g; AltName: Full=Conotoxin Tx5.3 [Conus textile]
QTCCGSKVFCC